MIKMVTKLGSQAEHEMVKHMVADIEAARLEFDGHYKPTKSVRGSQESLWVYAYIISSGLLLQDCPQPDRGMVIEIMQQLIATVANDEERK